MNAEDLFYAIGNMDDRYIDDRSVGEIPKVKRLPLWSKLVAACACVTVLVLSVVSIWEQGQMAEIVYPTENAPTKYMQSEDSIYPARYSFNYADLALFADTVLVAEVTDTFLTLSVTQDDEYRSYANVKVAEVLKGTVGKDATICVQDTAYIEIGKEDVYSVAGGPLMETGNRVLLFLSAPTVEGNTANDMVYYTQAVPWIGVFFYDRDGCYHVASDYGRESDMFKFTDHTPKTLSEIRRLIAHEFQGLSKEEYELLCKLRELFVQLYQD